MCFCNVFVTSWQYGWRFQLHYKVEYIEAIQVAIICVLLFCDFQASDAYHVFTSGQAKIQQGLLHEGYELISEALNLLNNVYGAMHPEIAACARLLARLSYIMGDYSEVGIC